MVEYGNAIGGEPHVALEAVGPELSGQPEGVERVLRGVGPAPRVSEGDRGAKRIHPRFCPTPDGQPTDGATGGAVSTRLVRHDGRVVGRVKANRLPTLRRLSHQMRPPCNSTNLRQM